ncbi:MAG TPA: hypothetical protein DEG43_01275 [Acidimicrobiaceae bacterium]|nr:hypothetical protein [Acidimicrobiaceae bacterium]
MNETAGESQADDAGRLERLESQIIGSALGGDPETTELALHLMHTKQFDQGEELLTQGEVGEEFLVVTEGTVIVEDESHSEIARLGPGSVLGEIALLHGSPISATVRALSPVHVLFCGADEFEQILETGELLDELEAVAETRLGSNWSRSVPSIPYTLRTGALVDLRPLMQADEERLIRFDSQLSEHSRRLRFLTGTKLTAGLVRYLIEIDQRRHIAWVATDESGELVAIARAIRLREEPEAAEFAIAVRDDWQGHGLGMLLFGVLGSAASALGVRSFIAHALWENTAMLAMLAHLDAEVAHEDPGVFISHSRLPHAPSELEPLVQQIMASRELQ